MDIMHACEFIPFQWPRKEKIEKTRKNTCMSEYLEPYLFAKSPPDLPT
jgi:hypothetical protein